MPNESKKNKGSNLLSNILFPVLFYAHEAKQVVDSAKNIANKSLKKASDIFKATSPKNFEKQDIAVDESVIDLKVNHSEIKTTENHLSVLKAARDSKQVIEKSK